jgi:hypothetical protein
MTGLALSFDRSNFLSVLKEQWPYLPSKSGRSVELTPNALPLWNG